MWRLEFSIDEISIVNQVKTFRPVVPPRHFHCGKFGVSTRVCVCLQGPLRECTRAGRFQASPPYYYTPLVCVPSGTGGLAVWRCNNNNKITISPSCLGDSSPPHAHLSYVYLSSGEGQRCGGHNKIKIKFPKVAPAPEFY